MFSLPSPRKALDDWAVDSQMRARRNAMLAATDLAQRRAERLEVDAWFAYIEAPTHGDESLTVHAQKRRVWR